MLVLVLENVNDGEAVVDAVDVGEIVGEKLAEKDKVVEGVLENVNDGEVVLDAVNDGEMVFVRVADKDFDEERLAEKDKLVEGVVDALLVMD